jgi:superoxide oxidase
MNRKYGSLTIGLHWFMLILFVAVYALIEFRELYPKGSDIREGMKALHFALGMSVLAFVVLRIAVRLFGRAAPQIEPTPGALQQMLAKLIHLALYAFMIAMPIIGWLMLSAAGKPIPFGLPPLMGMDKEFGQMLHEAHEVLGKLGYALIGLHALAALFHHYLVRDNTLRRILPFSAA